MKERRLSFSGYSIAFLILAPLQEKRFNWIVNIGGVLKIVSCFMASTFLLHLFGTRREENHNRCQPNLPLPTGVGDFEATKKSYLEHL